MCRYSRFCLLCDDSLHFSDLSDIKSTEGFLWSTDLKTGTRQNKDALSGARNKQFFGEFLVKKGLLTSEQLEKVLSIQEKEAGKLGEVIVREKFLSDTDMAQALAEHLQFDFIGPEEASEVDTEVARRIPEGLARRFELVALWEEDGQIALAMSDPQDVVALDTIRLKRRQSLKPMICTSEQISKISDMVYHGCDVEEQEMRDLVELEVETGDDNEDTPAEDFSAEAEEAPVIRFVNLLLDQAVKSRASDVHVEPQEKSMKVRMRVDGELADMVPPSRKMQSAVIARLKILAQMDIAERRLPQDGRFKMKGSDGRSIDVRVSAIPTIYGEKIVMRILDASAVKHDINLLGFEPDLLEEFKAVLEQPHGIIIVTGPTGSGKSTTLYSVLNYLKDPKKNITTVEDPVEYRLDGINQIQIRPQIDLTFAACLRAILRQDPDIILLGEIRDKETVDIAVKASLTGHLVLSTFHTNDAPSAVSRLVYMGVERYLLASTINLVLAQRLVRRVCDNCRQPAEYSDKVLESLKINPERLTGKTLYKANGCEQCNGTGYRGRVPIFEFMVLDTDMRNMITHGCGESELRDAARNKGYGGLLESGSERILKGLTTPEEVLRVTYEEDIKKRAGK